MRTRPRKLLGIEAALAVVVGVASGAYIFDEPIRALVQQLEHQQQQGQQQQQQQTQTQQQQTQTQQHQTQQQQGQQQQ